MSIENVAIFYRPSKDKPCETCVFIEQSESKPYCTLWDAEASHGMGCAYWLKKARNQRKGVDGNGWRVYTSIIKDSARSAKDGRGWLKTETITLTNG